VDQTINPAVPARTAAYQAWGVIIGLAPAVLSLIFGPGLPPRNLASALAVAAAFALAAALLRAVDWTGAIAGFGVALTLYALGGAPMFAVLFFVFVLTWAATRAGYARKLARSLAEDRRGRTATQVVANVGLAAGALVLPLGWARFAPLAACAAVAVLAEAAADTCASEMGKAYARKTVLFTNGRPVAPGTDGGVSWMGSACGLAAAVATAAVAASLGAVSLRQAALAALAGVLGTCADSALGATLERRGWLNNDAVNLLSTLAAALLAALVLASRLAG
jgi:uncharacterized protein (TIGR00297 family)